MDANIIQVITESLDSCETKVIISYSIYMRVEMYLDKYVKR